MSNRVRCRRGYVGALSCLAALAVVAVNEKVLAGTARQRKKHLLRFVHQCTSIVDKL